MDKLERVARAIARDGFGRDWDDFLPVNAHDTDQGDLMEYAQAAIAALEPMDKPRVKPLVWERMKGIQTDFKAKSILGVYLVECFDDGDGDYYVWALEWGKIEGSKMQSAEAAKAAAQADYEARILAALEPVTVQEAARDDALTALDQLEVVEDAYTRWMLANAVGDPDLVYRDGNKLSKALFAMLNDGPDDGPSTILRALRALAEMGK